MYKIKETYLHEHSPTAKPSFSDLSVKEKAAFFESQGQKKSLKQTASRKSSFESWTSFPHTSGYGTGSMKTFSLDDWASEDSDPSTLKDVFSECDQTDTEWQKNHWRRKKSQVYVQCGSNNQIMIEGNKKKSIIQSTHSLIEKHRKKKLHDRTEYDMAMGLVKQNGIVVIKGCKSTKNASLGRKVFADLSDLFKEKYCIAAQKDLYEVINPDKEQLIFIDEMFGRFKHFSYRFDEWSTHLDFLTSCLKQGNTKFIITVNDEVIAEYREQLNEYETLFGEKNIVHLVPYQFLENSKDKMSVDSDSPLIVAVCKGFISDLRRVLNEKKWSTDETREALFEALHSCEGRRLTTICHLLLSSDEKNIPTFSLAVAKNGNMELLEFLLVKFAFKIDDYIQGRILDSIMLNIARYDDEVVVKVLKHLNGKRLYFKSDFLTDAITNNKQATLNYLVLRATWTCQELEQVVYKVVGIVPCEYYRIFDLLWNTGAPLNSKLLIHVAKLRKTHLLEYILKKKVWTSQELTDVFLEIIKSFDPDKRELDIFHLLIDQEIPLTYHCLSEATKKMNVYILDELLRKGQWQKEQIDKALEELLVSIELSSKQSPVLCRSKRCCNLLLQKHDAKLSDKGLKSARSIFRDYPDALSECLQKLLGLKNSRYSKTK